MNKTDLQLLKNLLEKAWSEQVDELTEIMTLKSEFRISQIEFKKQWKEVTSKCNILEQAMNFVDDEKGWNK